MPYVGSTIGRVAPTRARLVSASAPGGLKRSRQADPGVGAYLEHDEVLHAVDKIVTTGIKPSSSARRKAFLGQRLASPTRAAKFVNDVRAGTATLDDERATDPMIWRRILEETTLC